MEKLKICFATINSPPDFLGGYSLYHKNLIEYIKLNKLPLDISWVYFGNKNDTYTKEGIHYFELKSNKMNYFVQIKRNFALAKFFKSNYFNIINSTGGIWTILYKKREKQKIIHTFHGTTYYFNKNQMNRLGLFKKILVSPILPLSWILERPHKKTDKIICVSEKVKRQVENLYGKRKNTFVIRTGVNLENFKPRDKEKSKKKINLDKKNIYGLYVGGGGAWGKGLDRALKISKEIYKINKYYKLIVAGADYKKVKNLLNEEFIMYFERIDRANIPYYYNAADIFFCVSRYEGGAPTLVTSEAMASGCLLVCSKDAEQEIIQDGKNGLVLSKFGAEEANKIIRNIGNKNIIRSATETIKNISLEKWGKEYLNLLIN